MIKVRNVRFNKQYFRDLYSIYRLWIFQFLNIINCIFTDVMSDLKQFFDNISANVKQMKEKQPSKYNIQRKYGKKTLMIFKTNTFLSN